MSPSEREILAERGLFEMIRWAGAIHYVTDEAHDVLMQELHAQLAERLPQASEEHVRRLAGYIVQMSVAST